MPVQERTRKKPCLLLSERSSTDVLCSCWRLLLPLRFWPAQA
jgi:hypothetical protein